MLVLSLFLLNTHPKIQKELIVMEDKNNNIESEMESLNISNLDLENLDVEELEHRLELATALPMADCWYNCGTNCGANKSG